MAGLLSVDDCVRRCPEDAEVRGMFFLDAIQALKGAGVGTDGYPRYQPFRMYPQRAFIELAPQAAARAFSGLPLREGLRRLGRRAYETFAQSMAGRVMFGALGRDVSAIMGLVPRGYSVVISQATAELVESGARHVHIRLRNVYTFIDSYQIGVFEGAVRACGEEPVTYVKLRDATSGEFIVTW